MTIHLMDILVPFLPEYDHSSSKSLNDEQIKHIYYYSGSLVYIPDS